MGDPSGCLLCPFLPQHRCHRAYWVESHPSPPPGSAHDALSSTAGTCSGQCAETTHFPCMGTAPDGAVYSKMGPRPWKVPGTHCMRGLGPEPGSSDLELPF